MSAYAESKLAMKLDEKDESFNYIVLKTSVAGEDYKTCAIIT